MIGQIISNYKIVSVIGEGGMGNVYLAQHQYTNQRVAIKSLHQKYLANNHIKERFRNEAGTLSQIEHPNIVKLFDFVEKGNGLYLIMELVEGIPLDEYIRNESGPIPENSAIKILNGMLEGFSFAHSRNIIHRDVKPSNIMISRDFSVVKILDFGIAKILGNDNRELTKHGTHLGTVFYMSPEQVRGLPVDKRSDIYALGVTCFQMITGKNPYEYLNTDYEIYNQITQVDFPDAKTYYPFVSDKISDIIKKATQKNAAERYQNCIAMLADLNRDNQGKIHPPQNKIAVTLENEKRKHLIYAISLFALLLTGFFIYFIVDKLSHKELTRDEPVARDYSINRTLDSKRYDVGKDKSREILKDGHIGNPGVYYDDKQQQTKSHSKSTAAPDKPATAVPDKAAAVAPYKPATAIPYKPAAVAPLKPAMAVPAKSTPTTPAKSGLHGIIIGTQSWATKNLDVSYFRNGDPIPEAQSDDEWVRAGKGKQPAWCYYNNDPMNGQKYGKLYNWYAVNDTRGLAPEGWHIPSDAEWSTLSTSLDGAVNSSGFAGLPGGSRNGTGPFPNVGYYGNWWSASEDDATTAWYRYLYSSNGLIGRSYFSKRCGFSVRCLRD